MKVISNNDDKQNKKHLNLHMQTFENEFKREAEFLKKFNHPHIIKMANCKIKEEGENERPNSGESRKSNKSNNSSSGEEVEHNNYSNSGRDFSKYIILEYADNGDLFDFVVSV